MRLAILCLFVYHLITTFEILITHWRLIFTSLYYNSLVHQDRLETQKENMIETKQGVHCCMHTPLLKDVAWVLVQRYGMSFVEKSSAKWVISDDHAADVRVPNAQSVESQIRYIIETVGGSK